MSNRVLFLYVTSSGGHQHAADAMRGALHTINPSIQTIGLDTLIHSYPTVGPLLERFYLELVKHTPHVWDYLYDNDRIRQITREIRQIFNTVSTPGFFNIIKEYKPDVIVCTQAMPCSWIVDQKKRGKLSIPLVAVVTDFAVHAYWLYHEVDAYIVAHENLKQFLVKRGIAARKVHVTGIPIDTSFSHVSDKLEIQKKLGFGTHQHTLLIMGGGHGLGPVFTTVRSLLQIPLPLNIIVITGTNKHVYRELKEKYGRLKKIRIIGHTKHIARFMAASDILITKPGGLTSSEALAVHLPIIIYNPLPGQEQRNTRFLISQNVAEKVNTTEELCDTVYHVCAHPERLYHMKNAAQKLAKPYASLETAHIIMNFFSKE